MHLLGFSCCTATAQDLLLFFCIFLRISAQLATLDSMNCFFFGVCCDLYSVFYVQTRKKKLFTFFRCKNSKTLKRCLRSFSFKGKSFCKMKITREKWQNVLRKVRTADLTAWKYQLQLMVQHSKPIMLIPKWKQHQQPSTMMFKPYLAVNVRENARNSNIYPTTNTMESDTPTATVWTVCAKGNLSMRVDEKSTHVFDSMHAYSWSCAMISFLCCLLCSLSLPLLLMSWSLLQCSRVGKVCQRKTTHSCTCKWEKWLNG